MAANFDLQIHAFDELSGYEVYDILMARAEVFVVEQRCAYQDVDGVDWGSYHLSLRDQGVLAAYTRLIPPQLVHEEACAIGRVLTTRAYRRHGLGRRVMRASIDACTDSWPGVDIRLGAQVYLLDFYRGFGFVELGEPYLEDGIPHQGMIRRTVV